MFRRIFQSDDLHREFTRKGFVVIPFLTIPEFQKLKSKFEEEHPVLPAGGFHSSTYSSDRIYKKRNSDFITAIFKDHFDDWFVDFRPLGSAWLYKLPGKRSDLILHQDWTIVDESRFIAANVWVPLVDADVENGTLHVLTGSHRIFPGLRGPTIPFPYQGNEDAIKSNLIPLIVKAGDAVVLNQALVHQSPENRSGKTRAAITSGIVSKKADLKFYFHDRDHSTPVVREYAQNDDFLIKFDDFFADIRSAPTFGSATGKQFSPPVILERKAIESKIGSASANTQSGHSAVLFDPASDIQLFRNGYAIIDFITAGEAENLNEKFMELAGSRIRNFYAVAHDPNIDLRLWINEILMSALQNRFDDLTLDMKMLGGTVVCKEAGCKNVLDLHQDWTIVNEPEFRSFNFWIPLVDVGVNNGIISVIPGSHDWSDRFRGPNMGNPWSELAGDLRKQMVALEIKSGQALVYDHRLLHGSGPNDSRIHRTAAVMGAIPGRAKQIYCYRNGKMLDIYDCKPDFFLKGNPGAGPAGLQWVEQRSFSDEPFTKEQYQKWVAGEN